MSGRFTRSLRVSTWAAFSLVLLATGPAFAQIHQQFFERVPPGADAYEGCDPAQAVDLGKLENQTGVRIRELALALRNPRDFSAALGSARAPDDYRALHEAQRQYARYCERLWLFRHRRYQVRDVGSRGQWTSA